MKFVLLCYYGGGVLWIIAMVFLLDQCIVCSMFWGIGMNNYNTFTVVSQPTASSTPHTLLLFADGARDGGQGGGHQALPEDGQEAYLCQDLVPAAGDVPGSILSLNLSRQVYGGEGHLLKGVAEHYYTTVSVFLGQCLQMGSWVGEES